MNGEPYVGQIVYEHYTPAAVGTIVAIVAPARRGYGSVVRIKWASKKRGVTEVEQFAVRDYESLVTDHERKAKLHRGILERLRKEGV